MRGQSLEFQSLQNEWKLRRQLHKSPTQIFNIFATTKRATRNHLRRT